MDDKIQSENLGKGDSDIVGEMRGPCYAAWTAYRDQCEADGDCADITDFRTGFVAGWAAREALSFGRSAWRVVRRLTKDKS